jgi:hypothetical protein
MEELFNEDELFNRVIDISPAMPYISSYYKRKLNLCDKPTHRGFILTKTDDNGVGIATFTFWVFLSFIISYKNKKIRGDNLLEIEIDQHSLSLYSLGKLKLSARCFRRISEILSYFEIGENYRLKCNQTPSYINRDNFLSESHRIQSDNRLLIDEHRVVQKHNNLLEIEKEKLVFELSDCKKELEEEIQIIETERYVYREEKKMFDSERKAFEKENQELKKELEKYKSIISNCQREIKAYGL